MHADLETRAIESVHGTRGLRPVTLAGFMDATGSGAGYALDPIIPRNVLTLLGGHGGAGKSNLALTLVAHGACGEPWAGRNPEGRLRCVYVSLEDAGDLVRYRLRRIAETYRLDARMIEANVRVLDGTGGDAALMYEAHEFGVRRMQATALMEELAEAAEGADLVVIDNASDAFDGNENERRSVRAFIRALVEIGKANSAAVLLLAHLDKQSARFGGNGNSYSGSTAWHNSARSRLALVAHDDGTVELIHEKNNLGKTIAPIRLHWNDLGVLVPVTAGMVQARTEADTETALRVMAAARQSGIRVPVATSGSATAWLAVSHLPELGDLSDGKDARRRFHAALDALCRAGQIARVSYKDKHRNQRESWELTQTPALTQTTGGVAAAALRQSPTPPVLTNARTGGALVTTDAALTRTNATNAKDAEA